MGTSSWKRRDDVPSVAFEVYDDLYPAARSQTGTVEPLFACFSSWDAVFGRFDDAQDLQLVECELRMSFDDVPPSFERHGNPPAVRIDRLPHPSVVPMGRATCRFALSARSKAWLCRTTGVV